MSPQPVDASTSWATNEIPYVGDKVLYWLDLWTPGKWASIPDATTTIIALDENDKPVDPFKDTADAAWRFLHRMEPRRRNGYASCQYLVMRVWKREPAHEDCAKFAGALAKVFARVPFNAKLSTKPLGIRMAHENAMLCHMKQMRGEAITEADLGRSQSLVAAYLHTKVSREELNRVLGFEGFVLEGRMPEEWP